MQVRVLSGALKGVRMHDNEDIWEKVERDGLGYTVQFGVDATKIIDPTMRLLFEQAKKTLDEIDRRLDR